MSSEKQNNNDIPYDKLDKPPIEIVEPTEKKEKKPIIFIGIAVGVVILCVLLGVLFAKLGKANANKSTTAVTDISDVIAHSSESDGIDLSSVAIPDCIGKTKEEADGILNSLGITYNIINSPSSDNEKNKVIAQDIEAGRTVPEGTVLTIVIGEGAKTSPSDKNDGGNNQVEPAAPVPSVTAIIQKTNSYAEKTPKETTTKKPVTTAKQVGTIIFDANGGSVSTSNKKVNVGDNIGTLPTATRTGYTFDGWYTHPSGGSQITEYSSVSSSNQTLYAHWTPKTYDIRFDANGGSVAYTSTKVNHGEAVNLPTPTRNYYTFNGWYTSKSGGNLVTSGTKIYSSATLYAQWSENKVSDWVEEKNIPNNAKITDTKTQYKYQEKEYKKNQSSSSLSGWTLYNTNTLWGEEKTSRSSISSSSTRKVWTTQESETQYKTVYWYKRYYYKNTSNGKWYSSYGHTTAVNNGYNGEWQYMSSETELTKRKDKNGKYITADGHQEYLDSKGGIWFKADCNPKQGTKHTAYAVKTPYQSQYTLYHYQDAYYTYDFYRWSSWSDWSDNYISETDSRKVQTRKMYKYQNA